MVQVLQKKAVLQRFCETEVGLIPRLMQLAGSTDRRVCRHAVRVLSRTAEIDTAKTRIMENPSSLTLLLSLAETGSLEVSRTVARILAELAEAWQNRAALILGGVLDALVVLINSCVEAQSHKMMGGGGGQNSKQQTAGFTATSFECARCLADLAEAPELRLQIASSCLNELQQMMTSPLSGVAEQAVRCVLNLVSVAGVVAITKNTAVDLHLPSGEVGVGMTLGEQAQVPVTSHTAHYSSNMYCNCTYSPHGHDRFHRGV
jgi:hypothetical protein